MSIRLFRTLALAAVALALALPAARSEEASPKKADQPKSRQFTGILESVDAAAGTCTIKKVGKDKQAVVKTFKCAPDCKMTAAGKDAASLADYKAGDKVTVHYTAAGDQLLCQKMALKPAKQPKEEPKEEKKD
jgi:Cu/Ag efflux protein CusF